MSTPEEGYEESKRVYPDESKLQYNIEIPQTKGGITRVAPDLSNLDVSNLPTASFSLNEIEVKEPKVIEKELLTGKVRKVRELQFDFTPSIGEYFAYLTRAILERAGSTSQFAELLPKVKEYTSNFLFEREINTKNPEVLKKLNTPEVRETIYKAFVDELNDLSVVEEKHEIASTYSLRDTPPFHTTKEVYSPSKSIFNFLPYDSPLEEEFMRYLDSSSEVEKFTKVFRRIPLRISYFLEEKGRKYYIPDFVVKTADKMYLIETKGETFDDTPMVRAKSKAAEAWCQNISEVSDSEWEYIKISSPDFNENRGVSFSQLIRLI